jgi:hypothetical protein
VRPPAPEEKAQLGSIGPRQWGYQPTPEDEESDYKDLTFHHRVLGHSNKGEIKWVGHVAGRVES